MLKPGSGHVKKVKISFCGPPVSVIDSAQISEIFLICCKTELENNLKKFHVVQHIVYCFFFQFCFVTRTSTVDMLRHTKYHYETKSLTKDPGNKTT